MVPALRVEHREWPGPCSDGDESIATVAVRADDALPDNIAADKDTKLRHSTHQPQKWNAAPVLGRRCERAVPTPSPVATFRALKWDLIFDSPTETNRGGS
jgi:hypothetical protein